MRDENMNGVPRIDFWNKLTGRGYKKCVEPNFRQNIYSFTQLDNNNYYPWGKTLDKK